MGHSIEGDMDIQNWQMKKYGDISPVISHEMYVEYLNDKEEVNQNVNECLLILSFIGVMIIILLIDIKIFQLIL